MLYLLLSDVQVVNADLSYPSDFSPDVNGQDHHLNAHQHQQFDALSSKAQQHYHPDYQGAGNGMSYGALEGLHMQSAYGPSADLTAYYDLSYPTQIYANGAVELGSMCVPASMTMDGMHAGGHLQS